MKKKSTKAVSFFEELHKFIIKHPQFRKKTSGKSEIQIQTELRPVIIQFLERYFSNQGYSDAFEKANSSFYWGGQEGKYGKERSPTFGSRNYPDFIVEKPYSIAIEYKQSPNGSIVKHGIGQSIVHTLSGEFDFVYYLFHDQNSDKRIEKSIQGPVESSIINRMWSDFNVKIEFV